MSDSWTTTITEDGLLIFPPDMLEKTGWKEGDVLVWVDNKDGTWSLIKEELTNFIVKGYN